MRPATAEPTAWLERLTARVTGWAIWPLLVALPFVAFSRLTWPDAASQELAWPDVLLGPVAALSLAGYRRWPGATAAVLATANLTALAFRPTWTVGCALAALVSFGVLSSRRSRREAVAIVVASTVALALIEVVRAPAVLGEGNWLSAAFAVALAVAVGDAVRSRNDALEQRAAALRRAVTAEVSEAEQAERGRIARDLHDTVAHYVSEVAVRAEVLTTAVPDMPPSGVSHARAIAAAARSALVEMRQALDLLRDPAAPADLSPARGLGDIEELVTAARAAGDTITLTTEGDLEAVPAAASLGGYRIVQEGLTNARRHAPGAAVTVCVRHAPDTVHVAVANPLPPGSPHVTSPAGHGLAGLTERIRLLGGTLTAGMIDGSTWALQAELPLTPPRL